MPRIPTYTAEGGAAAVQFPQVPAAPAPLYDLGQPLGQLGSGFGKIAADLRMQQDELDTVKLGARYTEGIATIHQDVLLDPSLKDEAKAAAFATRSRALLGTLMTGSDSSPVRRALEGHAARATAQRAIQVHGDILQRRASQQVAELKDIGDILGRQMAEGEVEADRIQAAHDMNELTARAVGTGLVTPQQGQALLAHVEETAAMGEARKAMRVSPEDFAPLAYAGRVSTQHLIALGDEAQRLVKQQAARIEANFKAAQKLVHGKDTMQANYGLLSDARLDEIASGRDAYYPDPGQAVHLKAVNEKAPFGEGKNSAVAAILSEHAGGRNTVARGLKALEALNQVERESTRQNPDLLKAKQYIQAHIESAAGADRGERGTAASEKSANITSAARVLEGTRPAQRPSMLPTIRQRDANTRKQEEAEARYRAGRGQKPEDIAKDIHGRGKAKDDAIPPRRRSMQEMTR